MNTENVKSKLCFDMRACRKLIRMGCKVIDCKPLKTDKTKTVLVFQDDEQFQQAYAEVMNELKSKDEVKQETKSEDKAE